MQVSRWRPCQRQSRTLLLLLPAMAVVASMVLLLLPTSTPTSALAALSAQVLPASLGIAIGCLLTEPLFAAADFGSPAESLDLDAKVAWTELSPEVKEVGKRIRCTALLLRGGC